MKQVNVSQRSPLARRLTMTACVAAVIALATSACTGDPGVRTDGGEKGREAPMLAALVESGDLPPIDERIPESPQLVEVADSIGVYGGEWRAALPGADGGALDRTVGYEMLLRWRPTTQAHATAEIVPNIASNFETSDDGRTHTITIREGMRWSDGAPFTVDDVIFAIEDVFFNTELYPSAPASLRSGDTPVSVERVDDSALSVTFAEPNAQFPHLLASKNSGLRPLTALPKHYLEQFHAEFNPDIDALVSSEGVSEWTELFFRKAAVWDNVELPRMHPWLPLNGLGDGGTRISFERNPYYWKVDSEGSQLPYLDRVVFDYLDPEVMVLRASAGDIDMQDWVFTTMQNKPVLADGRAGGDYEFVDLTAGSMNTAIISLNLTHPDPAKREVFQNKDFRIGLSLAIDRQEIIDAVYREQGEPWQVAPLPGSDAYDEEMATQYADFDVDLANDHLDRAGLTARDGDGFRLGPDGKRIQIVIDVLAEDLERAAVMELIKGYWAEVGVDSDVRSADGALIRERRVGNQHDVFIGRGDEGGFDWHLTPAYYMPFNNDSAFAIAWAQWYQSGGSEGEEPPAGVKAQLDLYAEYVATVDETERERIRGEFFAIAKEQFYAIGVSRPGNGYAVVRNDFHNVPAGYILGSNFPNPAPANPEQFYSTR